jgi:hypothetical protein
MGNERSLAWTGGIAAIVLGLLGIVVYGYATWPRRVGATKKTPWDGMELSIVPVVLAIHGSGSTVRRYNTSQ